MAAICHSCGSHRLEILYDAPAFDGFLGEHAPQFNICRCEECELVNTVPLTLDSVPAEEADYSEEYYGSSSSKFMPLIEATLKRSTAARARFFLKLWREGEKTTHPPSVLDIGCGRGLLLRALQAEGAHVTGLERNEFPIDASCSDIVLAGSIYDDTYKGRKFDIIILWHVLEHLTGQDELLGEIANHLNEDGLLIMAVPNFGSWQQKTFAKNWFHLDLPRHLVHLDSSWLLKKLSDKGFKLERESHIDLIQNCYGFIQSFLNQLAPRHPNAFYSLLKHRRPNRERTPMPLIAWSLLSLLLAPFSLLELVVSGKFRSGATLQIYARLGEHQ